jgi:hypothetical protein
MKFVITFIFSLALAFNSFAAQAGFITKTIWLVPETFISGETVRINAAVFNSFKETLLGQVQFYDGAVLIGSADLTLGGGGRAGSVWIDWTASGGKHTIRAVLTNTRLSGAEGEVPITLDGVTTELEISFIDSDTDGDTLPDSVDNDDDGDGLSDEEEQVFGTSSQNPDTDGDGVSDLEEYLISIKPSKTKETLDILSDSVTQQKNELATKYPVEKSKEALANSFQALKKKVSGDDESNLPSVLAITSSLGGAMLALGVQKLLGLIAFLLENPWLAVAGILFMLLVWAWRKKRRRRKRTR